MLCAVKHWLLIVPFLIMSLACSVFIQALSIMIHLSRLFFFFPKGIIKERTLTYVTGRTSLYK